MTLLLSVIVSIACSIIATELLDLCPRLTEKLLIAASARVPAEHRSRYLSEWLADADHQRMRSGKLLIFLWALTVYVGAGRLAAELSPHVALDSWSLPDLFDSLGDDDEVPELDIPAIMRRSRHDPGRRVAASPTAHLDNLDIPTIIRLDSALRNDFLAPRPQATIRALSIYATIKARFSGRWHRQES